MASRAAKQVCDEGRGVGETGLGVYLDFREAIQRLTEAGVREKYGNLFQMYDRITGEDPYKMPMRIYPALHYTMGGLWVDYNLMSNVPGLFILGEANFSDHGANRLGASALMQGLADGYFVVPYTIGDYLVTSKVQGEKVGTDHAEFKKAEEDCRSWSIDCWASRGNARWSRSTASWARSCGSIAAWPATRPACKRRCIGFRSCARNSGGTSTCWAITRN